MTLHGTQAWRRRAKLQLAQHPMCQFCLAKGQVTPARIADHIEPHHGDPNRFILGALQSLCKACHDSTKKQQERNGFARDIGLDGLPLDRNHPAWRR